MASPNVARGSPTPFLGATCADLVSPANIVVLCATLFSHDCHVRLPLCSLKICYLCLHKRLGDCEPQQLFRQTSFNYVVSKIRLVVFAVCRLSGLDGFCDVTIDMTKMQ